jgi:pectinesterase
MTLGMQILIGSGLNNHSIKVNLMNIRNSFLVLLLLFSKYLHAQQYEYVVAQDGSGNFKSVQEAINAVPDFRKKVTTIFIKSGTYKEKLILAGSKKMVKFIGENVDKTILTYDDYAQKLNPFGEEKGTSGSSSFYVYGDEFTAENITF